LCLKCGKIITYAEGEAIICQQNSEAYKKFYKKQLSIKLAQDFFSLADKHKEKITLLKSNKRVRQQLSIEIHSSAQKDIFLEILQKNNIEKLDDLLEIFSDLGIKRKNVEYMLREMKCEGLIYHTKPWLIRLIK